MSQILSFENLSSVSEFVFRDRIWKTFRKALKEKQDLILDFRNVRFMVSTVVPKLCCLGEIGKKAGITLTMIPSIDLAKYLAEMGFWRIAADNGIFSFDEKYLEIFITNKKVTNALFCIKKEELKRKYDKTFEFAEWVDECTKYKFWVRAELTGVNNTVGNGEYFYENIPDQCKAVLKTVSGFVGYSEYTSQDAILGPIVELVHNAVWHSQGKCYFLAQTSDYKGDFKRIGIDITVADTGCGLYKSLLNKTEDDGRWYYKKEDFIRISNKTEQNYCSIIEALFFREQSETRGLYDIITDLTREPSNYFCEMHLINGNIALDLLEGQRKNKDGEIYEVSDISNFVYNGIEEITNKGKKYFVSMPDIGFSFCIDICIKIPRE